MTKRFLSLVAVLAVAAAACGGNTEGTTTTGSDDGTSSTGAPAETTTTAAETPEAVLLSYALEAGDEYRYEVGLDQHIELQASGDASLMGGEDVPGDASVDLAGTATFTHVVSDGSEPGTYDVHITGDFADVSVTGVVDGESVDSSEAPDFATLEPIDVTVTVDEQGNLIRDEEAAGDPLAGMFGDMGALGSSAPTPGLDLGQFIGPPMSDEEVVVGDTWSEEIETPGLTDEPIVTSVTSTVTGVDQVDGIEVLVIESNTSTSLIEFDLAEFFGGMFGAFLPDDATDVEKAELEEMMAQLQFLITIDGSTADSTTLFDAEAGLARQSSTTASTNIAMDMNVPDEETGEMVGFEMNMTLDQDITYQLISGPQA
jgi:hypothetical protein